MHKAQPITIREWIELSTLPAVQKAFGYKATPILEKLTDAVYGARFVSSSTGKNSDTTTYMLMGRKGGALLLQAQNGHIKQLGTGNAGISKKKAM